MLAAGRCVGCADPACIKACPQQVDLRALFRYVAAQTRMPATWRQDDLEAEEFAATAIQDIYL